MTVMPVGQSLAGFEHHADTALRQLRAALAGVIASIPCGIRRAADLERALDLGRTLAWQVFRIAGSTDPVAEGTKVPGRFAMERFFEAAARAGVPARRIRQAQAAFAAFDQLVDSHAGDRATFESMLTGVARDGLSQIDLQHRRAAFKANSHIWGVQARTHLWCSIYFPSIAKSNAFDVASLRGRIGLKRLRGDAAYVVGSSKTYDASGTAQNVEPLGSSSSDSPDPRLLVPFCTRPLPNISTRLSTGEFLTTELAPGPIGNEGASAIILADVARDIAIDEEYLIRDTTGISIPVEVVVVDVLIDHRMFGALMPKSRVFGRHSLPLGKDPALYGDSDVLPIRVSAHLLGRGPSAIECPDVPRYGEMLEHVCAKVRQDPHDFDVYRCRLEYPVLHAHVGMWFDLPQSPENRVER